MCSLAAVCTDRPWTIGLLSGLRDVVIATHPRQKLNGSDGPRTIGAQPGTVPENPGVARVAFLGVRRGQCGGTRRFALGVITPVSGPRPYDFEVVAQFRCGF